MSEKEQEKKIKHCRANVKKKQMAAAVADKEEKDTRHGRIMDERSAKHWTHARTHTHIHIHKSRTHTRTCMLLCSEHYFASQSEK